ncbi:MAG: AMP-binding protein [Legionellaceae bacterium]|nr:AMP-binding protein [Legionellaceae bacterium]
MGKNWQETIANRSRWLVKNVIKRWFRVEVRGEYQAQPNAVVIANRTSVLDVLLLSIFLPEPLTVALPPELYKKHRVKALMLFAEVIPIDPSSAAAARVLVRAIRQGKRCLIFPQGLNANDETGLKIYDGPGLILQKAGAPVIPIRIEGAQKSIFSISKDITSIRLFPKIILHIMPPMSMQQQKRGGVNRQKVARKLFVLISEMNFANYSSEQALFPALLEGARVGIKNKAKLEDMNHQPLDYRQLLMRIFILGRQFKTQTTTGETIGLMLPTTLAGLVSFFALQAYRRLPAMLNFSSGFYNIYSACKTANIRKVYTARQFISNAKLETLVDEMRQAGIEVYYLEDFKNNIGLPQKLAGLLKGYFPQWTWKLIGRGVSPDESAVVLFTSGSEGVPKGVVLSHKNVLANCFQIVSRVDFSRRDVFFNALPIFHSFGLTAGCVLPLVTGNRCFFYPSPLHYKMIPGLVYESGATIMLSTDTFLTGYARAASSHEFSSLRYIFAGAERVKPETIQHWAGSFGVRIFEGYGATEASPVISLNCPLEWRAGTVGLFLPEMEYRLDAVDGIEEGARLFIRGPNVMRGYLRLEKPGIIEPLPSGWHDTGDVVSVDEDGFMTIRGRLKRFAKLGGEMVSLTAIEAIAASLWPERLHAAIALQSEKKGEQIYLYSDAPVADKSHFIRYVREHGHSELLVPKAIMAASAVPVLASGKIDYMRLMQQAEAENRDAKLSDPHLSLP